jgi:hypothetical protein
LRTVLVCVTVGVGTFNVLAELTHTVDTGSMVVDFFVLMKSFCTVCVVPGGVDVVLTIMLASLLMISVEVGRIEVRVPILRDVAELRIVWAGRVVLAVLSSVLVVTAWKV